MKYKYICTAIKSIIIRSKFFSLFIGREHTTWPANNCLEIMVCSSAMPSNSVWLQIIFYSCVKETVLFSFLCDRSCVKMADPFASKGYSLQKQTQWSNDKTIIELGYRKISWFVSVSQINYLLQPSALANNIIDLLATDKLQYFAQPRPIIVKYLKLKRKNK